MDYFTSLPTELLAEILIMCYADVLRVRQCSRRLYEITRPRTFWIKMGIPENAVLLVPPTDNEFEIYAIRHLHFCERLWRRDNGDMLYPRSRRVICDSLREPACFALLPDGRHLLAFVDGGLQAWDLGIRNKTPIRCVAFAKFPDVKTRDNPSGCILNFQFEEGKCAFILDLTRHPHRSSHICVFHLNPQPTFTIIGTKMLDYWHESPIAHFGDKLVFKDSRNSEEKWTLSVFDFASQVTWASCPLEYDYNSVQCKPILTEGRYTLVVQCFANPTKLTVLIFSLPDFSSEANRASEMDVLDLPLPRVLELSLDLPSGPPEKLEFPSDMIHFSLRESSSVILDTATVSGGDRLMDMHRIRLSHLLETDRWHLECTNSFSWGKEYPPMMPSAERSLGLTFPDGNRILWFLADNDWCFPILLSELSCSGGDHARVYIVYDSRGLVEEEPWWLEWEVAAFSPVLGWLVAFNREDSTLEVYDYVE